MLLRCDSLVIYVVSTRICACCLFLRHVSSSLTIYLILDNPSVFSTVLSWVYRIWALILENLLILRAYLTYQNLTQIGLCCKLLSFLLHNIHLDLRIFEWILSGSCLLFRFLERFKQILLWLWYWEKIVWSLRNHWSIFTFLFMI